VRGCRAGGVLVYAFQFVGTEKVVCNDDAAGRRLNIIGPESLSRHERSSEKETILSSLQQNGMYRLDIAALCNELQQCAAM
jgi:hypothetical protein